MKQATAGSGSAADPSYPDTAAANAELEAKLTGGNTGGAGSAMPNEAQVRIAGLSVVSMQTACTDLVIFESPSQLQQDCIAVSI